MGAKNQSRIEKIKYSIVKNRQNGFPVYRFKIYTDIEEFLRISGHRFVSLVLDNDDFRNDADILLQFLSAKPFEENDYMKCGKELEQPVIDASKELYGLEDVETFGFEDLKNGTDEFYFIRDLEYTKDGERYTGEVKTFYNKKKIGLSKDNPYPMPHITWWLQLRLELEIMKPPGGKGQIFYYFVDKPSFKEVLANRPYSIKHQNLFASEPIIKYPTMKTDPYIVNNFFDKGFATFRDIMDFALERKEEMSKMYKDDEGTFYYVESPIRYPHFRKFNHIKNFIEENKKHFNFELEYSDFGEL